MDTVSTKIKDFKVGDKFRFYGETFEVTDEVREFPSSDKFTNETVIVYGRHCKIVSTPEKSNISGLLLQYNWMQGTEVVTYAKIIEG